MRSYETARGYFSFIGFLAAAVIAIGVVLAVLALANAGEQMNSVALLATIPGLMIAGAGLFIQVYVQTSRAAVDSAEYAQQSLQLARDQLDISKQLLKLAQSKPATATYTAEAPVAPLENISFDTDAPTDEIKSSSVSSGINVPSYASNIHQYEGAQIKQQDGKFLVDDRSYDTLIDAKLAIDGSRLSEKTAQLVSE